MKYLIIISVLFIFTNILISKGIKDSEKRGYNFVSNSVYFTTSEGVLYHSGDFGFTFEKVNIKSASKIEVKSNDNYKVHLSDKKLIISSTKSENNVKVIISDLLGKSEIHTINFNNLYQKEIELINKYKILLVNIIEDNGYTQSAKLIN